MSAMPAEKMTSSGKVGVVRVESLDGDGQSFDPPEFEYWVVVLGGQNPRLLMTRLQSYQDALDWIAQQAMVLGAAPP